MFFTYDIVTTVWKFWCYRPFTFDEGQFHTHPHNYRTAASSAEPRVWRKGGGSHHSPSLSPLDYYTDPFPGAA